ncbi:MAG: HAD-IIB family hydrolase [Thainema sp.]
MLLIFTDLDGTLLNQDDYDYQAALPQLERLKQAKIPVIPVTSKTRAEVEHLRQAVGLSEPFIVENGSGVFIPQAETRFDLAKTADRGTYRLLQLGCTYAEARAALGLVAQALELELMGFGDMSVADVVERTGLPAADAEQAKMRDFTEPFVTPKQRSAEQIEQAVQAEGFQVVVGDRFSHLIGPGAGKGKAVQQLVDAYQRSQLDTPVTTIGLGNSPNDLAMLEVVDIPVVIPGLQGPHPQLANRGWRIADAPGCQGWASAIADLTQHLA